MVSILDMEWHSTPHIEPAEYWASPTQCRNVNAWDIWPSTGEGVCVYSRVQGTRTCTQVRKMGVELCDALGCTGGHVAVNHNPTVGGDSGGPWSWGTKAYGIHTGYVTLDGAQRSVYSEVWYLNWHMGLEVLMK